MRVGCLNSRFTNDEIKFQTLGIEVSLKGHPSHCPSHSLLMGIVNISLTLQRSLVEYTCLYTSEDISSCLFLQSELSPFWNWLFKNKQNNTLDTKPQLISWPFLTWDFICVYYSQGRKFFSLFTCGLRGNSGPSHSHWVTSSAFPGDRKKLAPVLMSVRTQSALSPFQKTTPFILGISRTPVSPPKCQDSPKTPGPSPWAQGGMCPHHPFLRSLCFRNM